MKRDPYEPRYKIGDLVTLRAHIQGSFRGPESILDVEAMPLRIVGIEADVRARDRVVDENGPGASHGYYLEHVIDPHLYRPRARRAPQFALMPWSCRKRAVVAAHRRYLRQLEMV